MEEVWNLNEAGAGAKQPPFFVFDPSVYTEEYLEKLKLLKQKKEKKERKNQKKMSRNVKSSFVVSDKDNYDIDQILQDLGEVRVSKSDKKSNKKN